MPHFHIPPSHNVFPSLVFLSMNVSLPYSLLSIDTSLPYSFCLAIPSLLYSFCLTIPPFHISSICQCLLSLFFRFIYTSFPYSSVYQSLPFCPSMPPFPITSIWQCLFLRFITTSLPYSFCLPIPSLLYSFCPSMSLFAIPSVY